MRNRLKVKRAEHELTQAELAKKVLVSRQTINAIEAGRYVPSTVLALKIAAIMKTPVDQVFILGPEDWPEGMDR
jgi:putative transcriptional regulator